MASMFGSVAVIAQAMTASAANGFMNTNIADCTGTPFTFHAEYSTAKQQNQVPWAALEGGVLMQQEIGHSEVCNSVTNQDPFNASSPGQSTATRNVFDTCVGGSEGPARPVRVRATRHRHLPERRRQKEPNGPVACPTNNATSGANCEFADGNCFQQGTGRRSMNGVAGHGVLAATSVSTTGSRTVTWTSTVLSTRPRLAGRNREPSDRVRVRRAVPGQTGSRTRRSSSRPTSARRRSLCDTATGTGCTVPPQGSKFYPFWSLSRARSRSGPARTGACGTSGTSCRTPPRPSARTPSTARLTWPGSAGTSTSPVQANPAVHRGLQRVLADRLAGLSDRGAPPARRGTPLPLAAKAAGHGLRDGPDPRVRGQVVEQHRLAVGAGQRHPPVGVLVDRCPAVLRPPLARRRRPARRRAAARASGPGSR